MNIAAFKVSHSVPGIDTTALRAARARSSSIGAMERYTWVRLSGKLTNCHNAHSTGQHSSVGRWMEFQGYFKWRAHLVSLISVHVGVGQHCRARDVESPALPTMSTRNVPAGRWRKRRRRFKKRTHRRSVVVMDITAFKVSHSVSIDRDATALPVAKARSVPNGALK